MNFNLLGGTCNYNSDVTFIWTDKEDAEMSWELYFADRGFDYNFSFDDLFERVENTLQRIDNSKNKKSIKSKSLGFCEIIMRLYYFHETKRHNDFDELALMFSEILRVDLFDENVLVYNVAYYFLLGKAFERIGYRDNYFIIVNFVMTVRQ